MALPIDELTRVCDEVAAAASSGRLVPFLGAGINMCGRTPPQFVPRQTLPSGSELAQYLATRFDYPSKTDLDLARVAQFVSATKLSGPLYDALRDLFRQTYQPTALHRLLAASGAKLRLIITTNYDDLMEQSLEAANVPHDIVWYDAEGRNRGRFLHRFSPIEPPRVIESPNTYDGLDLSKRPVVLKIHGAIDRFTTGGRRPQDSFVITEDHYIEYLLRSGSGTFLPSALAEEIGECHILFIGYGLKDWNMRVLLRRVWQESRLQWPSWAVQRGIDPVERELWKDRNVSLIDVELDEYTRVLEERIQCAPR